MIGQMGLTVVFIAVVGTAAQGAGNPPRPGTAGSPPRPFRKRRRRTKCMPPAGKTHSELVLQALADLAWAGQDCTA
jgi:hypothetical protein